MLRHELYKIFNRKSVLIALAIFIALSFLSFFVQLYSTKAALDRDAVYSIYKSYEGDITKGKMETVQKEINRLNIIENRSSRQQIEYNAYSRIKMAEGLLYKYNGKVYEVQNNIKNTNGYEKKQNQMLYNMLINSAEPKIFYTGGWDYIIDFVYSSGTLIMVAMILLGLASVFSAEYSQGMDSVILSSKNGKRGVITAKIIASIIYIVCIDLLFLIIDFVFNSLIYGLKGWNAPMQSLINYIDSPYAFTVLQYYFIQIVIHLTGCIAFGMFVLLISSLTRNAFIPFSSSALLFLVPVIINSIIPIKTPLAETIMLFSLTWVMQVERLFQLYRVYNIFGQPVLYPVLLLILTVIFVIISLNYIYKNFKGHEETI